jgi:transcriptional regulator with XRE-family HTH domain
MRNVHEHVCQQIRELRASWAGRGISQAELARQIGVPQNRISRWETGAYRPSLDDVIALAEFFGVPIARFFPSEDLAPEITQLIAVANSLDPASLKELLKYALFKRAMTA